jgi:hypothetical protein
MRYRKLRIAWSVAWGIISVMLVVFWVRSYSWGESLSYTTAQRTYFGIRSDGGHVHGFFGDVSPNRTTLGWLYTRGIPERYWRGFLFRYPQRKCVWFVLPCWFLLGMTMLSSAGPWFSWHFSLRTLLIATMLLAVLLGLITYFMNRPPKPVWEPATGRQRLGYSSQDLLEVEKHNRAHAAEGAKQQ